MYLTLLTVDRNVFGALGWISLIVLLEFSFSPESIVPTEYGEAISRGCGYINNHLCVLGGCYYKARIVKRGPLRPSLTRTVPTFVEIEHSAGYLRWQRLNITKLQSVECAITNVKPAKMEILVSLIPALSLAAIIIVLLIFLRSANQPYVLMHNDDPKGVDELPMKEFSIADDDDEDIEVLDSKSIPKPNKDESSSEEEDEEPQRNLSASSITSDLPEDQNATTSKKNESAIATNSSEI